MQKQSPGDIKGQRSATLLKKNSDTGVFLLILQNF